VSGASRQLRYEWQREVRRYRLGHTTKSVAQYLALYADNDGRNAYPGVSRLAAECEMDERTVRKALQELKRVGLIELVTQGSAAGRQAQATVYNLTLPGDLAERLELVTVQPSKPAGSRRPRTGTPGPEPGDPEENTGSTARCSDPEHRILDPEHGVLSTGTPGPEYRNTGSRTRPHMPHMERDTPDGEERTGADRATVRPDDAATPCVPDTRPVPSDDSSDDQTPTAPVCTTRGHKGCGWLSTRNCLDCLSAEETRARLAELDDGDAA
jgi:hypothetical protein